MEWVKIICGVLITVQNVYILELHEKDRDK